MGSNPTPLPRPETEAGAEGLAAVLATPAEAVVALDFDGTLADIVADPEQARAHPAAVPALVALAPHLASVVVITGRPAAVAVEYGGFAGVAGLERLVVLGHYGAERWDASTGTVHAPPPHPGVSAARAELPAVLERFAPDQDVWTEDKGQAFAVHTRRAGDPEGAFAALRAPLRDLATRHELVLEPGRMVLELRPPGMDKGVALTAYLQEAGARTVVYAGDDLGDLSAFDAVASLRGSGGAGLLVSSGTTVPELTARADLNLAGPGAVADFLGALADTLAGG
ncbi:trehalose-phosphatase [Streptomyces fuscigenes]|uniref:trehalose-phosphatase n=1 Tax=Streptomyces fuscigenes TaxID=1528880 RepID=UPI001F3E3053|nr:trehalose-phosphatase [Streptomyces fuscigenes]MCF3964049.1 trehalose-phosphatase [Streptomyces fuscigenes]